MKTIQKNPDSLRENFHYLKQSHTFKVYVIYSTSEKKGVGQSMNPTTVQDIHSLRVYIYIVSLIRYLI